MDWEELPRVRNLNHRPVAAEGRYVLYWMTAARRTSYNFGLQRAAWWAGRLSRPLLILEALRVDYPWPRSGPPGRREPWAAWWIFTQPTSFF